MKSNRKKPSKNGSDDNRREPFSAWSDDPSLESFPLDEHSAPRNEEDGRYFREEEIKTPKYADGGRNQERGKANGQYRNDGDRQPQAAAPRQSQGNARRRREQSVPIDERQRTHHSPVRPQSEQVRKRLAMRKKRRTRRILLAISIFLAVIVIGVAMVWSYMTGKFIREPERSTPEQTVQITDEEGSVQIVTPTPIPEKSAFAEGIQNILLIGSDSRQDGEHDLADVIMIMTIDNHNQVLKLSSVQRDMLVYLAGETEQLTKINAVLGYGPGMLVHTINENLSLDLQGYVEINMDGTETIIDMMGGIEIDVPEDEDFIYQLNLAINEQNVLAEGWTPNENYVEQLDGGGYQLLNGRQALAYMRVRKTDSDYRRTERQRQVMELLMQKFLRQNPIRMTQVVREGLAYVHTDLSNSDILSIATSIVPALDSEMQQMQIPLNKMFWEDQSGNIVPSFNLMNPEIHQFIYGDRTHQLAVPQIPQAPALETNYYIEPQTERFFSVYGALFGEAEARDQSQEEYLRQSEAGYVPTP